MKNSKLLLTSLLAAATMGTSAYAGFVWNGGEISQELWQAKSSWTLTDGTTWPTGGNGPLTADSNAWNGVTVANAFGTVDTFEGWELGITLQNANLTVTNLNKFQGGCTLNLDAASVLSMTLNGSGMLDGNVTVNTEGVFNLKLDKNYTGGGFVANLGNGGVMNFTSTGNAFTTRVSTLNATLNTADFDRYTIDANGNTVYTRNLIRLGDNVSFDTNTTTTVTMDAGAGTGVETLTSVEDISGAAAGSYKITKGPSGYSVSYVVAGTTYAWNATAADSVWDTSAENWTTNGGSTSIAFENDKNVLFGAGETLAKTVAINSAVTAGTISVADDYTFNVGASGSLSATAVAVAGTKTATLNLASNMALSANLGGSGTLKKTGTGLLTYSGTISSGATLEIASAGATAAPNTFSGTLSAGGNLIVSGGAVVKHEIESGKVLSGNITITGDGSTFIQKGGNQSDQLNYDGTTSIVVKDGGTLALGSNRWTFNANNSLSLDGGNITGTNQSGSYGNLDFNAAKTLNVLNSYGKESTISASIRLRNNLTFNVIGDATLNITGKIANAANTNNADYSGKKIIKTGSGKMTLDIADPSSAPSENFTGGLDVNGGEVEVRHANALGSGAVTVNGTGSVLDFAVSGGTFTQDASQALTTTNGGKITVSAGTLELRGAVNLSNAIEVASGASVTTSGVKFALSGLTGTANGDGSTTFRLFTLASGAALTWDSLTAENLNLVGSSLAARDARATFDNAAGTVTVSSTAGDLVWNGTSSNSTWNYSATNTNWKIGDAAASFQYKDNVTFGAAAEVKEVRLENGADIVVDTMTVADDYKFLFAGDGTSAKISGKKLEVAAEKTLTVGNNGEKSIALDFTTISLKGTLNHDSSADSWSSLSFDGDGAALNQQNSKKLSIDTVSVNANASITGQWGGNVEIGKLLGAGHLTVKDTWFTGWYDSSHMTFVVGNMSEFTGTLSLEPYSSSSKGSLSVTLRTNTNAAASFELGERASLTLEGSSLSFLYKNLTMENGSSLILRNGANGTVGNADSTLTINAKDGFVTIGGSLYGNNTNLSGKVTGTGTLKLTSAENTWFNNWKVSAVLSDGSGDGDQISVDVNLGSSTQIVTLSGENTYSGGTTVTSGTLVAANTKALGRGMVKIQSGATLNLGTSAVTVAGLSGEGTVGLASSATSSTLTVNQTTDTEFAGTIAAGIALLKDGAGTLTLSGDNAANTNGVTISGGKLIAAHASALGTGKTTVESGAKLGLVAGTTVTVTNGIDLKSGAKLVVDLSSKASATETFTLNLVAGTALSYSGESVTSTNANILLGALELDGWNQSGWTQSLAYIEGSNTLQLTMTIPEPSTFGLLAGLGALALAGTRRRRKKA